VDGNKVRGDDLQDVLVNAELDYTHSTRVDEPQTVCLALLKLELGKPCVVDAWSTIRDEATVIVTSIVNQGVISSLSPKGFVISHNCSTSRD
jgi:hypothetical protein